MNCFKNERQAQQLLFLGFLLLQVVQDIGFLIDLQEELGLCVGKLILDLSLVLAVTVFSRKYSLENFWYLVLFSRGLSMVFIFALSLDFPFIYLAIGFSLSPHLLHNHYNPAQEFLLELLLRTSIIIALLNLSRPYMEALTYAAAALCQLLYLLMVRIQAKTSLNGEADLLHPSPTSRDQPRLFHSLWNKLQDTPFLLILANRQTQSVQQISQTFKVLLEDQKIDETAQKDFIMSQLRFHIVRQQSQSQQSSAVKKQLVRQRKSFIYFGELSSSIFQEQYTLTEIIQQHQSMSLQIYTSYTWQDGQQLILAGSVQFSDLDDDIMIIFNDITCQTELQQKNIKNDFKSKIIESFSHEMRTPLNSAINFLTMAMQEESLSESFKQCLLEPALNSLKQQTYLINDIIDFSQFYTGSLKLNNRDFNLTEFIQEISELFRLQFEYKQIGFIVDLSQTHTKKFTTDYTRLMQIIVNLLQNALKFSTQGCVMLKIKQVGVNLKFSVQDEGIGIDSLKLTLIRKTLDQLREAKDFCYQKSWQGFGLLSATLLLSKLAPEGLDHIKIHSQGSFRGTKVSIIIENQILISPNHQRYLNVQSHSYTNYASMIYVVEPQEQKQIGNSCDYNSQQVPQEANLEKNLQFMHQEPKLMTQLNIQPRIMQISDQTSMKMKRDIPSIMSYKSKHMSIVQLQQINEMESEHYLHLFRQRRQCLCLRVLTVDDEIFNQFSVRFILQKLGFEVFLAYNGQQALEVLKQTRKCGDSCQLFSLILMDYQMPILDGIQTTKMISQLISQQILPKIPIFGLTAFTSSTDVERCLEAGMSKVLGKPLNLGEFKEALTLI